VTAGGRALSEPYYSQLARSVFVSLSTFFIFNVFIEYEFVIITLLFYIPLRTLILFNVGLSNLAR